MRWLKGLFLSLSTLALGAAGGLYLYQSLGPVFVNQPLLNGVRQEVVDFFNPPCREPISYRLGQFDERFAMSEEQLLAAIDEAAAVWEQGSQLDLFIYAPQGDLAINLVYDYRQEAAAKLKDLGYDIDSTKQSYDDLKVRFDDLKISHEAGVKAFESLKQDYETQQAAYNAEVNRINARGGATPQEAAQLNSQRESLQAQIAEINRQADVVNQEVATLNAMVDVINRMAADLNLDVEDYNRIGRETGEEFQQGLYTSDATGTQIELYEFTSTPELVRLLAHELGHALGLEHVDDETAIMYYRNTAQNDALTAADLAALSTRCGLALPVAGE